MFHSSEYECVSQIWLVAQLEWRFFLKVVCRKSCSLHCTPPPKKNPPPVLINSLVQNIPLLFCHCGQPKLAVPSQWLRNPKLCGEEMEALVWKINTLHSHLIRNLLKERPINTAVHNTHNNKIQGAEFPILPCADLQSDKLLKVCYKAWLYMYNIVFILYVHWIRLGNHLLNQRSREVFVIWPSYYHQNCRSNPVRRISTISLFLGSFELLARTLFCIGKKVFTLSASWMVISNV